MIILLCRGLFNKSVWTLNFRHNPISSAPLQPTKVREHGSRSVSDHLPSSLPSESSLRMAKAIHRRRATPRPIRENDRCRRTPRKPSDRKGAWTPFQPVTDDLSFVCSEFSIPSLGSIIKRDEDKLNLFRTLKNKQIQIEEQAVQRAHLFNETPLPECKPPE